ncbi:MAG TPA: hypothetical protein VFS00_00485 [Polyangiaceae bacterium]|nr:hypothetical protein [Polyangiaceae bacterium]
MRAVAPAPAARRRPRAAARRRPRRAARAAAGALALAALAAGCGGKAKVSEEKAGGHAARLAQVADEDVRQIRGGLPAGAKRLGEKLFAKREKAPEAAEIRPVLRTTREAVPDLVVAKSTFFAVVDPSGLVVASDLERDPLAGKSLFAPFPELARAANGYVETLGEMPELRSVRTGDDGQWLAATALAGEGGPRGFYVTGWSWRHFARHLEEQLKTELRYEAGAKGAEPPLQYAFVVVGERAYGAATTPEVSKQAIEGLGLGAKLSAGAPPWHGQIEITGRTYGVGAARAPTLCERCLVVALRSEI